MSGEGPWPQPFLGPREPVRQGATSTGGHGEGPRALCEASDGFSVSAAGGLLARAPLLVSVPAVSLPGRGARAHHGPLQGLRFGGTSSRRQNVPTGLLLSHWRGGWERGRDSPQGVRGCATPKPLGSVPSELTALLEARPGLRVLRLTPPGPPRARASKRCPSGEHLAA